jgi:DNA polymerase I-like protein with 3'-5' exonuclease and polymerase domains
MSLTSWDIETTIKARFKRKATPFGDLNHTVVHGWKHAGGAGTGHYFFGRNKPGPGWLAHPLRYDPVTGTFGTKLLAGMNIKFDLLHALQDPDNLRMWMSYVAGGGQIWDIQLAEYLLEGMGQKHHMLSLDEIAPRYGADLKIDEVKLLWNAGVETTDIDPDLLVRYLVGEDTPEGRRKGDVENTEHIALAQIKRAREVGQVNSIMLNMGALLCTIEIERNGMYVDMALALKLAEELKVAIDACRVTLEAYLPTDLPFEFKWTSRFHKSALIFGGTVQWDAHEYDTKEGGRIYKHEYDGRKAAGFKVPELVYAQKDELHYLLTDGHTMNVDEWHARELRAFDGLEESPREQVRFASGKNAGEPKTKKVKVDNLDKPKGRGVKAPYQFAGFTKPEKRWESAEPGVYSTASEVIEELSTRGVPFLDAFAKLQSLTKDLSTYYIVTDPTTGESKGMLSLVDEHGIIHHRINHTSTVTGRFSSSDPNLQNVSKGMLNPKTGEWEGSKIKLVFISRFGKDGSIIQSDFTALEVYVQAILTQCKQLIEDLRAGLDMHCVRVSQKEKIPYEEAFRLCKGYKNEDGTKVPADPIWDKKRTNAKVFSFQRAYGAGAPKIAASLGVPVEEIEELIAAETLRYPEIDSYYENLTAIIKANRRPQGLAVPHPEIKGVMCNLGTSSYRTPDGKLYSYQEHPAPEYLVKRGTFSSFSPTEIKNYVAQGEGGEWAKAAMWLAVREFYRNGNWGGLGLLINQVHDAVYADSHNDVRTEVAATLHACMEAASEFMEWFFKWEVPVPVPSDTTWGSSMSEESPAEGIKELAQKIRLDLRSRYMAGHVPSFN